MDLEKDLAVAVAKLESAGTERNRKIYARHGVRGACFGVGYAELGKLAKEIGNDVRLARALWDTGNHDARILATRIADPARTSKAELARWAKDLDDYVATDALAHLAGRTDAALELFEAWTASREEWTSAAGWTTLGVFLGRGGGVGDARLGRALAEIEERIHLAPNRTRYAMLLALIGIGAARPSLRASALAAASRIGPVEIDHGETGCKTPDAEAYIRKVVAHQEAKGASKRKGPAQSDARAAKPRAIAARPGAKAAKPPAKPAKTRAKPVEARAKRPSSSRAKK
jgi:3-methyladenine DNA glycosylase AlkD